MAEYIDKKDKNMGNLIEIAIEDNWELDYTLERLEEIPSADVAPIIHAKWIEHEDWQEFQDTDGNWDERQLLWYECSNCHKIEYDKDYEYCPHCGAKMDKE